MASALDYIKTAGMFGMPKGYNEWSTKVDDFTKGSRTSSGIGGFVKKNKLGLGLAGAGVAAYGAKKLFSRPQPQPQPQYQG